MDFNKYYVVAEMALDKAEFAKRLDVFLRKTKLSFSQVSRICGNPPNLSRSNCHRIASNGSSEQTYLNALPYLEAGLEQWMHEELWVYNQREHHLNRLFPYRKERIMIVNRCELTSTAIKFFNLKNDPFDVDRVPGDEELFSNKDLDDIAARLRDAVLYKRFIALVGAVGTGKTSMKIRVTRELTESKQRIHLIYPEFFDMNAVNVGAIASTILEEFEVKVPQSSTARVRKIKQLLTSLESDDVRIALVFDECHRLNEKVLVSLKNFWEMTNGGYSRLLGVVLFGQPKFVESTLRDVKFREIAERVQILQIPDMEKSAEAYLTHKIAAAGGDIKELFDQKSIGRICAFAKTPLALGNLANTALMEAFTKYEEKKVTSQMLKLPDAPVVRNLRAA